MLPAKHGVCAVVALLLVLCHVAARSSEPTVLPASTFASMSDIRFSFANRYWWLGGVCLPIFL
jgi:hypothetical protein